MAQFVYIYKGLGASKEAYKHLYIALENNLPANKYTIQHITPEEIIAGSLTKLSSTSLVCFGGGFTSGFAKALKEEGIANLKAYVALGGAYLGFGAGGYFGCDYIEFDVGGPLEKFSERDFRLYPGIGRGPVYPGFEYGTCKGVHAVPVTFQSLHFSGTFCAFIDGGGAFIPSDPSKPGSEVIEVTPLAKYQDLENNPAAIVKTEIGSRGGKAVLSGVHLEYDTLATVQSDPKLACLHDDFTSSKESQKKAFRSILLLLGLEIL